MMQSFPNTLPNRGDRIAVKKFCQNKEDEKDIAKKKRSLLASLRKKLWEAPVESEENHTKKAKQMSSHSNATKMTRKMELGWLLY